MRLYFLTTRFGFGLFGARVHLKLTAGDMELEPCNGAQGITLSSPCNVFVVVPRGHETDHSRQRLPSRLETGSEM
jgi:hypothetical protein